VVAWVVSALLKRMRANRASDKLVAAVVTQSKTDARPSAEALQLRERFEEAVATLKAKRRSGHSLYDLPWYVIVGAPGSGKTTALVNSGLNFPLEQRSGKGALRGVGGTRNCDWWFTDEAVFLDTAGRYLTQDSDASADSAGWAEFLALLRKYRKRRPVNGVILTISAQDLMTQGHSGREAYVAAARRRLNELNKELHILLPVYVMVTKCDLVAGFTEYFDDFEKDGRAQVWGVTFPYEQTVNGKAAQGFVAEFDALMTRLNERVFARLEEDRDVRRRTKVFAFPQQMAALRDLLTGFITDVFASTRFDQQILLRGAYFTSGTQEGTPIDRLLGAIGRRFSVAPDAVASPGGRGKAYFIERLLRQVLFAESGLAGVNRRVEVQKAAAQLGAYAAMALVAVLGVVVFTISYNRNRTYLDTVATDIATLQKVPTAAAGASLDLGTLLPRLDALRAVTDSANRHRDSVPWSMRWGLYQGSSLGNAARDAYSRELDGALLPTLAGRLQQRLVDYAPEQDKLFLYLKAYLMLNQPERLDKDHLGALAEQEWKTAYANDPDAGASLSKHFSNLLAYNTSLRKIAIDQPLVEQARRTLPADAIPRLIYSRIKLNYADDSAGALRIDALGADQVFRRKSGTSLSDPIPSLYTKKVFEQVASQGTAEIEQQFAADRWVWGERAPTPMASDRLKAEVLALYERDYISVWDGFLNDLGLASLSDSEATKRALRTLAGPTSPLRGLLQTVDANTFLVKPANAPGSGVVGSAQSTIDKILKGAQKQMGVPITTPGAQITAHFAPIHALLAGEPGAAPIDRVLEQIKQIQEKLQAVGTGLGQETSNIATLASVGQMSESLKQEATSLPQGVGSLVAEVGTRAQMLSRGGLSATLGDRYRQEVVRECTLAVANRYPFTSGSPNEVLPVDFGRVFGHGGVFDLFFKENLQPLVDDSRSPWAWRADASGAAVGLGPGVLRQFEQARAIREAFFRPGSQMPELRFTITFVSLAPAARRVVLELDGQTFTYRFEAERALPAVWPGPSPGVAAVTFEEAGGAKPHDDFKGAWAWFRLIDSAQSRPETSERYVLTFQKAAHKAEVRIEAASVHNPYGRRELERFRCTV